MQQPQSEQINPWATIWFAPRRTLHWLLSTNPTGYIIPLAIVGGILSAVAMWASYLIQAPEHFFSHPLLVGIISVVAGGLFGLIHLYFGSWLYRLTGVWVGGKGTFLSLKCAVGWSNYPFIITSLLNLCALFTHRFFWVQTVFLIANLVLFIWSFIILLKLIAEAHFFSAWRALATLFLAAFLVFVALIIIALLVPLLTPLFSPQ